MKTIITTLATTAALAGATSAATTIAVNFLRNPTTTPAANDGSEFGISTWEDVLVDDQTLSTDGVTVSWDTTGGWNGGSPINVENGYLDNAGTLTVDGLSAWLTSNGAVSYQVQLVQATDTSTQGFGNTDIYDTDSSGAQLDTLTNMNLRRGTTSTSISLTNDTILIDPTTDGSGGAPGASAYRTNVAGLIITAQIPEPTSTALLGMSGFAVLFRRKRS